MLTQYGKLQRQQYLVAQHPEMLISAEEMHQEAALLAGRRVRFHAKSAAHAPLQDFTIVRCVNAGEEVRFAGHPQASAKGQAFVPILPHGVMLADSVQIQMELPFVVSHSWLAKTH